YWLEQGGLGARTPGFSPWLWEGTRPALLSRQVIQYQTVRYDVLPLSPAARNRLNQVKRKVLVLDLDETLIHSHHDGVMRPTVRPGTPPDFILKVVIDKHPVRFFVHKRPHVDFFLEVVSCPPSDVSCFLPGSFIRTHLGPDHAGTPHLLPTHPNTLDNREGITPVALGRTLPLKLWTGSLSATGYGARRTVGLIH
uniref:FCP1 homology domain-containing protein n=1 Tax=Chelydra serpentina TaxID=8475 RepID=A0A8C3SBS4_CHESE